MWFLWSNKINLRTSRSNYRESVKSSKINIIFSKRSELLLSYGDDYKDQTMIWFYYLMVELGAGGMSILNR